MIATSITVLILSVPVVIGYFAYTNGVCIRDTPVVLDGGSILVPTFGDTRYMLFYAGTTSRSREYCRWRKTVTESYYARMVESE